MYIAERGERRLVLEGEHLPGWVPGLYFGGLLVLSLVGLVANGLRGGSVLGALVGLLCVGSILGGVPFVFFALSKYLRVEIEPGVGVRKYEVYRVTGPRLILAATWADLRRVVARPGLCTPSAEGDLHWVLRLSVEAGGEPDALARLDGGSDKGTLDAPLRLLREYLGDKLAVVEGPE